MELLFDRSIVIEDTESTLVRRIAAGDEDALQQMVAAYGQRLYSYALRLTGDPACADEAVQESLVAAWQNAHRFRGEGRVIAWLLGILHHKAVGLLRGQITWRNRSEPLEMNAGDGCMDRRDSGPLPDQLAAQREQSRLIQQALQGLSLEHRSVLELIFYQGLSLNEAAEVIGCPVGTVKSRLNYAKSSLRGVLNRVGLQAEDVE